MLRKIVFPVQFFGIAFLYIDQRQAKSLGVLRAGCKQFFREIYIKQTKALNLIRFCDQDKGKVLETLILKQVLQFQASWTWYFCRRKAWIGGRRWQCAVYMCSTSKLLKNLISEYCFLFSFFFCPLYYLILYEQERMISLGTKNKNGLEGSSKMVFCLTKQGFPEMTVFCLKQSQGLKESAA